MKKILKRIRNIVYSISLYPIIFVCHLVYGKKAIFCEGYLHSTVLPFKKRNWGDDLNKYFFEYISPIKILTFPFSKMQRGKKLMPYSLIGSILNFYNQDNKIIYGTGVMDPKCKILGRPREIRSVRGPESRKVLIENGVDCPEAFGDPVLLLPLFYDSCTKKTNKVGLILNMGSTSLNLETLNGLFNMYNYKIISMTNYKKWTDVIDEICSCSMIISESLHGLIVAETYGIPNVWVEFVDHPEHWNFKYYDFYESIGKNENIVAIKNNNDVLRVFEKIKNWEKGKIDYKELLKFYPFEIRESFKI